MAFRIELTNADGTSTDGADGADGADGGGSGHPLVERCGESADNTGADGQLHRRSLPCGSNTLDNDPHCAAHTYCLRATGLGKVKIKASFAVTVDAGDEDGDGMLDPITTSSSVEGGTTLVLASPATAAPTGASGSSSDPVAAAGSSSLVVHGSAVVTPAVTFNLADPPLRLAWDYMDAAAVGAEGSVTTHQYKLQAEGGSGSHQWLAHTKNDGVKGKGKGKGTGAMFGVVGGGDALAALTVGPRGIVVSHAVGAGNVSVTDARNPNNVDAMRVEVTRPQTLDFLSGPVEVARGTAMSIRLSALDAQGRRYHNCR